MNTDRPFLGIILMLGFCVLAPLGDSMAKLLGGIVSLGMLILVRFGVQFVLLLPVVWWTGASLKVPRTVFGLTLLRTCLHIAGMAMMYSALRYLPLADAVAIAFVMPFITLLLGHYFMGEEVGRPRMIACAVGFIGTLLVIQPNFVDVGWPATLPLGVAVVFALFMMITRKISRKIGPIALQAVSGLQAIVILLPVMVFVDLDAVALAVPDTRSLWLLATMGSLGTLAHLCMTWSLRYAPTSTLAPMQYLEIPFGTLIGWLIFKDLPNGLAAVGICITVGAGLYVIMRERRLSRVPRVPTAAE